MTWHTAPAALERYVHGRIDEASAFSVEAHLLTCETCRADVAGRVDAAPLDRIWGDVVDAIDRPRPRPIERVLTWLGVPATTARVLALATSLRTSWIIAAAVALATGLLAARGLTGDPLPFLVLVPLVPVAGVAASRGTADPIHEIGTATPTGGFRLALIRTTAILCVSVVAAAVASLGLPEVGWVAFAWLVPSLALTAVTLVLSSTAASQAGVAGAVSIAWIAGVSIVGRLASQPLDVFAMPAQVFFAALMLAAMLALAGRRRSFELAMHA